MKLKKRASIKIEKKIANESSNSNYGVFCSSVVAALAVGKKINFWFLGSENTRKLECKINLFLYGFWLFSCESWMIGFLCELFLRVLWTLSYSQSLLQWFDACNLQYWCLNHGTVSWWTAARWFSWKIMNLRLHWEFWQCF